MPNTPITDLKNQIIEEIKKIIKETSLVTDSAKLRLEIDYLYALNTILSNVFNELKE